MLSDAETTFRPAAIQSAANLGERAQAPDLQLQQSVLTGLLLERAREMGSQRFTRAQRRSKIDLVVAEEAGSQPTVGG